MHIYIYIYIHIYIAVAGDLVTVGRELSDQLGMLSRLAAEHEERGVVPSLSEEPADRRCVAWIGTVVEGQRKLPAIGTGWRSSNHPEQRQVLLVGAGKVGARDCHGARDCYRSPPATTIDEMTRADEPCTGDGAPDDRVPLVHD